VDSELNLHIVGLGLIGGSIARGLSDTKIVVSGWDRDSERLQLALKNEIIESAYEPGDLPEEVDGLLLALPVPSMPQVLKEVASGGNQPGFVTDVGSTKEWICSRAAEILPDSVEFVGAHPMAGSEKQGLEASDPLLFENAICVLTPSSGRCDKLNEVRQIWEQLGAHIMELSPAQHDRVAAHISHLPHVGAAALIHAVGGVEDYEKDALPLAAGGFRDTTRIASSDPALWRDILETNREKVLEALAEFEGRIEKVKRLIEEEDWPEVSAWLSQAAKIRSLIPEKAKGLVGTLYELRIQAPDSPGILAEITGILGEEEVNICDIEVLRVREGEKGTIRLAFRRQTEQAKARELLQDRATGVKII